MYFNSHKIKQTSSMLKRSKGDLITRNKPICLIIFIRVDLGVMAMKRYSTFSKTSELEPHHQMQFNVICKTLVGGRSVFPFF